MRLVRLLDPRIGVGNRCGSARVASWSAPERVEVGDHRGVHLAREDVLRQECRHEHVRDVYKLADLEIDRDAADRVGTSPVISSTGSPRRQASIDEPLHSQVCWGYILRP